MKVSEMLPEVGEVILIRDDWGRDWRDYCSYWKPCVVVRREDASDKRSRHQSHIWVSPAPPGGARIPIRRTCDLTTNQRTDIAVEVEPNCWVRLRQMPLPPERDLLAPEGHGHWWFNHYPQRHDNPIDHNRYYC